jgi:uncharacterized membrane protein
MWQPAGRSLTRKQRRLRVLSRRSWVAWALLAGLLFAIWGGASGFVWWTIRKASASDHLLAVDLQSKQDFRYDLRKLEPGQSRIFTYPISASERSRVLLNRDTDGVIRTAFASCTTCYSYRRQHYLKEGKFMCGQCQTAMRIGDQKERMTRDNGCVAVPVPFAVENNEVMVRAQAITEGAKALEEAAAASPASSKADAQRP